MIIPMKKILTKPLKLKTAKTSTNPTKPKTTTTVRSKVKSTNSTWVTQYISAEHGDGLFDPFQPLNLYTPPEPKKNYKAKKG